jgi:NAD-dependent oxidoreductase involved in siderophore biosynthesis
MPTGMDEIHSLSSLPLTLSSIDVFMVRVSYTLFLTIKVNSADPDQKAHAIKCVYI